MYLVENIHILGKEYNSIPAIVVQNWKKGWNKVLKIWIGSKKVFETCSVTKSWNCWSKGDLQHWDQDIYV